MALEIKSVTFEGREQSKTVQNCVTSFMDDILWKHQVLLPWQGSLQDHLNCRGHFLPDALFKSYQIYQKNITHHHSIEFQIRRSNSLTDVDRVGYRRFQRNDVNVKKSWRQFNERRTVFKSRLSTRRWSRSWRPFRVRLVWHVRQRWQVNYV